MYTHNHIHGRDVFLVQFSTADQKHQKVFGSIQLGVLLAGGVTNAHIRIGRNTNLIQAEILKT